MDVPNYTAFAGLLRSVQLHREPWLDSEVVGVLEGGEVVQIERSFRDSDGLVWALCASGGWVPPDPASGASTVNDQALVVVGRLYVTHVSSPRKSEP